MKIQTSCALAVVLLALAGCANDGGDYAASAPPPPTAAPPQRVNAVSSALGARVDNMVATRHGPTTVTR